ncbi:hypothetical protein HELRODRAFT_155789 [Helobdella robusta]|uniref:Actin, cytoplasmic n=1 Tax=Helobdella robusta TaxID=6412 RepID=T1ELM4_HELRO|nr:hypothetical protein HELRODRAFT_155789 [Helobdella robusta]ESO02199.1 hypothetical protein HELRODRAFT_155789 [Helobdella robusta]
MSGGVFGDDIFSLVFDIGSNSFRVGYAGEDQPRGDFPTSVGVLDLKETRNEEGNFVTKQDKYVIDVVNLNVPREGMEVTSCLKEGMVEDWEIFEKQIEYAYGRFIETPSEYHPVLMTESAWNVRSKREKLLELMMEKFNIPAFFLVKNATLSVYANGRTSGLVLDSGATLTSAVPVYDGMVIQHGIVKSPLAGDFILMECKKLLDEMGIEIVPPFYVAHKEQVPEGQPPIWKKRENIPEMTKSHFNYSIKDVLKDFAAQTLQVSDSPYDESVFENMPTHPYEFHTGYNYVFNHERFKIPEALFDPSLIKVDAHGGSSMLSMSHIVSTSVGFCDIDIKPSLYNNVIVVGGNTLLNGFVERLTRDLSAKTPSSMKLKIVSSPVASERKYSSWIGGSILGSLSSFPQMWISKQEYEEAGKIIVEKKCV